jgi:predicted choloylglycine hydrolase
MNLKTILQTMVTSIVIYFIITHYQPTQCLKYTSPYNIGGHIVRLYDYYPSQIKYIVPHQNDIFEIIKKCTVTITI